MSEKQFHICRIVSPSEEDYSLIVSHMGNYPVSISREFHENEINSPTLIVGWESVKQKFPSQNIIDKKISNNLSWSFSKSEDEKDFLKNIENFFIESMKEWLPKNFRLYDSYLNKEFLLDFIDQNINKEKKVFVFFHEGGMYLNNDGNNFIINIKALSSRNKDFRSEITKILNSLDIIAFSYHNFGPYVNLDDIKDIITIDNLRWVKYGVETLDSYFNIIPNFKIHKYLSFLMSKLNPIDLNEEELRFYTRMCKRDKITSWLSSREISFAPMFDNSKLDFKMRNHFKLAKINYSNKRTITGRIMSRDGYNPQTLDKSNNDRKNIISRFIGGKILSFDYVSFETKISIFQSGNSEYIEKYKDSDFHREIAVLLYETNDVSSEQREFAKGIVHPLLYGAGENTLLNILSCFPDPEYKLYQVRMFLKPIIEKSREINDKAKEADCVITPQGSIVRIEKKFAGFNNYIQAYASEIMVDKLFEVRDLLKGYRTEFMFQVFDSLNFDLHPEEMFLVEKIRGVLERYEDMTFGLSIHIGDNYKEIEKIG